MNFEIIMPTKSTDQDEFKIFLACADDGKGNDITNDLAPLPTFEEWLNR